MKYFNIPELCRSATAERYNIDNRCNTEHIESLTRLVNNILDPLRESWGSPIMVNSGFRSTLLNKRMGGKANSQHLKGEAADITAGNREANRKLFDLIISMDLPFDQLIDEKDLTWIHVSHKKKGNRKQVLKL